MEFKNRHKYLGASDCAASLGLSNWKTLLELWAEKTQMVPAQDISNKLSVKLGNMLEDIVARLFMKETGKKVRKVKEPYIHKKYDFIQCHIDRKVEGEKAILQCKTTSFLRRNNWKEDEIPAEVILQEYHELACSGYEKAYIAVLIDNNKFLIKELKRDEQIINQIIKKEVEFWNNFVIPKIMPQNIKYKDGDILYKIFPNAIAGKEVNLKEVNLSDEANQLKENIDSYSQDIFMLQKLKDEAINRIKAMIKDNEIGNTGIWKIFWKNVHKKSYIVNESNYRKLSFKKIDDSYVKNL